MVRNKLSYFILLIALATLVSSELIVISEFQEIAERVKTYPNLLQAAIISRFDQCERCLVGNKVFEQFSAETEGIVITYLVDCVKVWENPTDRERIPACDPKLKNELPHVTFFQPPTEMDTYNRGNRKVSNDVPYNGMLSPEGLIQKSKELLPNFTRKIVNSKELDEFLGNKEIAFKFLLLCDLDESPLYFRSLSAQFRGNVDFALVDGDNRKIRRKYKLHALPVHNLLIQVENDYRSVQYEGELTVKDIARFIQQSIEDPTLAHLKKPIKQGVYYDVSSEIETHSIRSNQLLALLKKHKEHFILLNLRRGNQPSKFVSEIQADFGNLIKYYDVECLQKDCEQFFPEMLNKHSLVVIYGIGQSRRISEFISVQEYSDKGILAERLLSIHNYSVMSENDVSDFQSGRKLVGQGVNSQKYAVIFFQTKYDYFGKLQYFLLSSQERFRKYLQFIRFINPSEKDLSEWGVTNQYHIIGITELNELKNTFKKTPFEYSSLSYENLINFLNLLAVQKQDEIIDSTKIEEIKSHEDYEKNCLNNQNKPCVIALLDMSREGKLKQDLEKLNKIRKIYAEKGYSFLSIDFKCHKEFSSLFKIPETSQNTIILLDSKKQKYRILKESLELESLSKFFDEVQGKIPRGMLSPLPGAIDIEERDCETFTKYEKEKLEAEKLNKRQKRFQQTDL